MEISVSYLENPFMRQLLLLSIHLPQTSRGTHPFVPQPSATHVVCVWENWTSSCQKSWVWFTLRLRNLKVGVYCFTCLNSTHGEIPHSDSASSRHFGPLNEALSWLCCLCIWRLHSAVKHIIHQSIYVFHLELDPPLAGKYWCKSQFTTDDRRQDSKWQSMNLLLTWFTHRLIYVLVTSL